MSTKALDWAFSKMPGVSPAQKSVLIALANYADQDGSCYPGVKLMADMTGLSPRCIRDALAALQERGMVTVEHRLSEKGDPTSNRYYLHPGGGTATDAVPPAPVAVGVLREAQEGTATAAVPIGTVLEPKSEPSSPPDGFEAFWDAYGLKQDKPVALRAWAKARKVATAEQIMFGLEAYHSWRRALGQRAPIQKYPASWLNAEGWLNDYSRVRTEIPKPKRPAPPKPSELPGFIDDGLVAVSPWA